MSKYPMYDLVGYLGGQAIYKPHSPIRDLAIEKVLVSDKTDKETYLVGMTSEQLEAWFRQERDAKMLAEIEEARREELEEIGHGLSSGRPHTPMIIRRDIE